MAFRKRSLWSQDATLTSPIITDSTTRGLITAAKAGPMRAQNRHGHSQFEVVAGHYE
jgi:hypothetical protein